MNLEVLFEDNHCLAVNKGAGVLSQGDASGDASLVDLASQYLKTRYAKPGEAYVGLLHRLDRPTSGVVLLAKTSKAAGRLDFQALLGDCRGTCRRAGGRMDRLAREGRPVKPLWDCAR
jgi:23S rRNA pseudouridine1911/1915/1917 synthase